MYLVYFDETGDPGGTRGTTPYFIVTGLIVHEENWQNLFNKFKELRQLLRNKYDIPLAVELKGHSIINSRGDFMRVKSSKLGLLKKPERLQILYQIVRFTSKLKPLLEIQNVCFSKKDWRMMKEKHKY